MDSRKKFYSLFVFVVLGLCLLGPLVAQEDEEEETSEAQETQQAAPASEPSVADDGRIPPRGETGFVEVFTKPEKAVVYLGGEELGQSPVSKRPFPSGRHDFTVMFGGEELIKKRVNVWPNQLLTLNEKLTMPYGTIILTTVPGFTKVMVDDEEVGHTTGGPLTINNVTAGSHIVKVSAPKRGSREVEVQINGEDTARVDIRL